MKEFDQLKTRSFLTFKNKINSILKWITLGEIWEKFFKNNGHSVWMLISEPFTLGDIFYQVKIFFVSWIVYKLPWCFIWVGLFQVKVFILRSLVLQLRLPSFNYFLSNIMQFDCVSFVEIHLEYVINKPAFKVFISSVVQYILLVCENLCFHIDQAISKW